MGRGVVVVVVVVVVVMVVVLMVVAAYVDERFRVQHLLSLNFGT